jgi:hypothetical protein
MPNVTATTFTFLGGQFQIGDKANTENFTTINQVEAVDFSGSKRDTEEVTSADNTDTFKRYAGRLEEPGTCTVSIWWNPNDATHQSMANANDGTVWDFKCINPGGFGTRSFSALIETIFDHKLELGKGTLKNIKLKLSGPITSSIVGA